VADAPDFERYDRQFDPASGSGGVEIWLPLKA
jgi:AraC family transcriptional regulator